MNIETLYTPVNQHADLVQREFKAGCPSRVIAAAVGIAAGVLDPDDLYAFCEARIGVLVQSGYTDEEEDEDSLPDGVVGLGAAVHSFESYLALHEMYGAGWLEKALAYGDKWSPTQVAAMIEDAKQSYTIVVSAVVAAIISGVSTLVMTRFNEVSSVFAPRA